MAKIREHRTFTVPLRDGRTLVLPNELIEEGRRRFPGKEDREILSMVCLCPPASEAPTEFMRQRMGEEIYQRALALHNGRILQEWRGEVVNIMCSNCGGDIREGGWFAIYETIRRGEGIPGMPVSESRHEVMRFPCPICAADKIIPARVMPCGIEPATYKKLADATWKIWPMPGRRIHESVIESIADRAASGQTLAGWVTLCSIRGTGKTKLVEWLTVQLAQAGIDVFFLAPFALERVLKTFGGEEVEDGLNAGLKRFIDTHVLVVDNPDLLYDQTGAGRQTYAMAQLGLLLDQRYRERDSKMTIFTLNKDPHRVGEKEAGAAIYNRMLDGVLAVIPEGEAENLRKRLTTKQLEG